MKTLYWIAFFAVLGSAPVAAGQDAAAVWGAVSQTAFDPAKSGHVENIVITRDRMSITLVTGEIQFGQPANGVVFAAAFSGRGKLEIQPPNPREEQQLQFMARTNSLSVEFTEATFSFTDSFLQDVSGSMKWTPSPAGQLADLYGKRQTERENVAAEIVPRVFLGVLSGDRARTAYFAGEFKTQLYGWVMAKYDALDPEQVFVGRWGGRTEILNLDTWMHFAAGNGTGDPFADPQAKDLFTPRAYHIDATVTTGAELSATTQVKMDERVDNERVALFALNPNLRVDWVKDGDGTSLAFFQPREAKDRYQTYGQYIAVVLAQASKAGKKATLEFHYAGKRVIRKVGEGNYFCPSYGWYPGAANEFSSRSDFELTFHYPKKYSLVATGSPVGTPKDGAGTWKSEIPLAAAGFAYGDYKENSQKVGNVSVDVFANRNPDDFLTTVNTLNSGDLPGKTPMDTMPIGTLDAAATIKEMNSEISNSIKLFQDYFGPYPYSHLAVTNIPYSYGQGWPGLLYLSVLSFLDSTQRHALGITDQLGVSDYFRAHETSHQWWGHRVGWKSYHDQWMSEGFANFSGNLYIQYRENPGEYLKRIKLDREQLLQKDRYGHEYESVGPVWMGERLRSTESPDAYDVVIYKKGGYILHMIRMMMRDGQNADADHYFKDLMHDFTKTYDNKPASTLDFQALVEQHMRPHMAADKQHLNMDWFFRQYVYGTGVAHYDFHYKVTEQNGKWLVDGTISQSGVPADWHDVLPVYVHLPAGKVVQAGWVRITGPTSQLTLTLPMKPDKISLNDYEEILAVVKQ
jgi:hypothetical protein